MWTFKQGYDRTDFFDENNVKLFQLKSKSMTKNYANLIRAAPEMLEKLNDVLDTILMHGDNVDGPNWCGCDRCELLRGIKQLVKKIEG